MHIDIKEITRSSLPHSFAPVEAPLCSAGSCVTRMGLREGESLGCKRNEEIHLIDFTLILIPNQNCLLFSFITTVASARARVCVFTVERAPVV